MRIFTFFSTSVLRYYFTLFLLSFYIYGIVFCENPLVFLLGMAASVFLVVATYFGDKKQSALLISVCILFSVLAFTYTQSKNFSYYNFNYPLDQLLTIKVNVIESPKIKERSISFLAKTIPDHYKVRITQKKTKRYRPKYGDVLVLTGRFLNIKGPTNLGQFNYKRYLYLKGIKGVFRASKVSLIDQKMMNPFRRIAYYLKARVLAINNKTLPFPYSDLYTGLVFGDHGTNLPEEMSDRFQKTGLTHLLVVSGSQVALLTGILLALFNGLKLPLKRSFILITVINIIFYFVTGGGSSIFRAILMCEVVLFVKIMKRNSDFYHIFGLTALIMLLINPFYLFDVGAQLSFMATFALVYGAPKIVELLPKRLPVGIRTALSISISPFIFSFPLLWFYFHTVSPISLISNLLVINVIELLVTVGFFSTMIGFIFLPLTQIINNFSLLVMIILDKGVAFLASVPFATIHLKQPHVLFVLGMYVLILIIMKAVENMNKKLLLLALTVMISIGLYFFIPGVLPSKYLKVTFIDVGQGDAILIETPNKKNILIDAGVATYDFSTGKEVSNAGKSIIGPMLAYKGINKLDVIVMSHFHADHMGGMPYLIMSYPSELIFDNGKKSHTKWRYRQALKKKNLTAFVGKKGVTIDLDEDIRLSFLYPIDGHFDENENNNSVVCKLSYKSIDFLFSGDLEEEKEYELAALLGKELEAEVFKSGHHGSNTSNTDYFLKNVTPKYVVISVGDKNKYGHPSNATLKRFRRMGIRTFRTDRDGSIVFLTDGERLFYNKYKGGL